MKKIQFKVIILLLLLSFSLNAQGRYTYSENKNFTIEFPSEVYYETEIKDGVVVEELLYNDDFETSLMSYSGDEYEYLKDFSKELDQMAEIYEYKEVREFSKGSLSSEIKYQFYIGYSSLDECNVIFGMIQNSYTRVNYDFELLCFNINLNTASKIINSIQL